MISRLAAGYSFALSVTDRTIINGGAGDFL